MTITPYLYYEDVSAALDWLEEAFGFERFGDTVRGTDGRLTHAAMRAGDAVIMLGWPGGEYRGPRRLGQATQSLYVTVEQVDLLFDRTTRAGAKVLQSPADTDYGHRRFGVEDPEGHQWYFGQPNESSS